MKEYKKARKSADFGIEDAHGYNQVACIFAMRGVIARA